MNVNLLKTRAGQYAWISSPCIPTHRWQLPYCHSLTRPSINITTSNRPLRRLRKPLSTPAPRRLPVKATTQSQTPPPQQQASGEDDPRGINGTAIFYVALVAAQLLPFSDKTSGLVGDLLYFSVTALSCIVIGVRRAPLEPPALSAPLSKKQVITAPFAASVFLFGSYLVLKYTNFDISLILNVLTTFGGGICLKESLDPVIYTLFSKLNIPNVEVFPASESDEPAAKENLADETIDGEAETAIEEYELPPFIASNLVSSIIALGAIAGYLLKIPPSFVFSNVIAVALATRVLSLIRPSSFLVASGLLVGLFFYDIFWVFGSEVMVSVATKIDTPGKLLFPRDSTGSTINYPYAILGLGDICVPGIFVSIAQSLDMKLAPNTPTAKQPYFFSATTAYIAALFTCFFVNFQTNAAQPALLYLVPALIGSSLAVGAFRGELKDVLSFDDDENLDKKNETSNPDPDKTD